MRQATITGAAGFIGWKLVGKLLEDQAIQRVVALDLKFLTDQKALAESNPKLVLVEGTIAEKSAVLQAVKGSEIVYHVASYGMSGGAQLQRKLIEDINVQGTKNVISCCQQFLVPSLVYISTYNVFFCGQTIINGDESLPNVNEKDHVDHYSRTKCEAEQLVKQCESNNLHTISIRPAGIYGEKEQRHFPRIINLINNGLGFFAIGNENILCDWVHADNLIHSILLAGKALKDGNKITFGKSYNISDDHPVNNFTFIKTALKCDDLFWFRVPTSLMYVFASIGEVIHHVVGPILPFEPMLTKAEVCKVGFTHFMSMKNAKKDLGYSPIVSYDEGISRLQSYFAPRIKPKAQRNLILLRHIVLILIIVLLVWFVLSFIW